MQRTVDDGVIISCDFCGTDWDQIMPMIEGHRGTFPSPGVMCLECFKAAMKGLQAQEGETYACTMCRKQEIKVELHAWTGSREADPPAIACQECVRQASGTFSKDPDVDWNHRDQAN